jgi:DNA-binding transcriptional regulator YiaG
MSHREDERMSDLARISWVRSLAQSGVAKSIRKAAGISIPELSRAVPCSVSTLWRWEEGQRRPSGKLAIAYAQALDALLEGSR